MCKIKNCKRKKHIILSSYYFCNVCFIEGVYSEKFYLVQKKLSALWSFRSMIFRFIETFL